MEEQAVIQLSIDVKFVLWVAGSMFTFISFLILLLGKMVISGINKTITTCHNALESDAKHRQEMNDRVHANYETRIVHLESAVFKPIGGRND